MTMYFPTQHNLLLQSNPLILPSACFAIKQPNSQLISLPIPRNMTYRKFFLLISHKNAVVSGECHWQMGTPNWGQSNLSKDGDVTWIILHSRIITPQQLYQWSEQVTALSAQEPQDAYSLTALGHSILESFSQDTPRITRPTHCRKNLYCMAIQPSIPLPKSLPTICRY
jgi:hypothetical protein